MRFLANLDAESEVSSQDCVADQLPEWVRACQAKRYARNLCREHAEFFSSVTPRKGGQVDTKEPDQRLVHWSAVGLLGSHGGGDGATEDYAAGTIELGNLARSLALDQTYGGEYFVYLLIKSEPSRTNAHVGWSTNPLQAVCHLNARQSASGGGGWELAAAVTPFTCPELAADFGQALVTGTRGYQSKMDKIPRLARSYNKSLYIYNQAPTEPLTELLECYTPPIFSEVYESLRASTTSAVDDHDLMI